MKVDIYKIDRLRNDAGMSTRELAEKAAVSTFTLSSIRKKGTCRDSTAEQIAYALGVPVDMIRADETTETPEKVDAKVEPEVPKVEKAEPDVPKEVEVEPEVPEAITETLTAIRKYGEFQYQKGKEEAIEIFKKAVLEAISRWEENNYEE